MPSSRGSSPLRDWTVSFLYLLHWQAVSLPLVPPGKPFSSVQSLSRVRLFATPWIAARQASLSITNSRLFYTPALAGCFFTTSAPWEALSSVQFSLSVISYTLWPQGLQHARLPCPSPTPEAYSNSCPSSRWCHPNISSSVDPFSSHPQSFPASGSFQMNQFFASHGQSIRVSASASVLPMNIQDWFPLELTGLISLQSKGLSRVFSNITVQKHQSFGTHTSLWSNSHIHTWLLEKP